MLRARLALDQYHRPFILLSCGNKANGLKRYRKRLLSLCRKRLKGAAADDDERSQTGEGRGGGGGAQLSQTGSGKI